MASNARGAGLLGFLLALTAVNPPAAEAAVVPAPDGGLEGRLSRLTDVLRRSEGFMQLVPSNDPVYVGYAFLNSAPSFRNATSGWINRVTGWYNHGTFANSGIHFLNNVPSFRNSYSGWPNHVNGWANGGGFHNGGGFKNGAFANGGGFKNGGGGFYNR
jgi:hypothetical protein